MRNLSRMTYKANRIQAAIDYRDMYYRGKLLYHIDVGEYMVTQSMTTRQVDRETAKLVDAIKKVMPLADVRYHSSMAEHERTQLEHEHTGGM